MVLSNNFSINNINKSSYAFHYNNLLSVQEADEAIKSSPCFQDLLEKVANITKRYNCESYVGLRLIHKHFQIEEGQIMVEDFQEIEGTSSLVTQAQDWEEALNTKALPSSWIFSEEGEVHTFETSTDPAVKNGIELIESHPEMMEEINKELQIHKLNKLLAVALLKRDSLKTTDNQMYLEKENLDKTILQVGNRNDSQARQAVNTSWSFKGSKINKPCIKVQTGCSDKEKFSIPKPSHKGNGRNGQRLLIEQ